MKISIHFVTAILLVAEPGSGSTIPGSERYMEFPNVLPGKILKVQKEADPQTGAITLVTNLPEIAAVNQLRALEISEAAAEKRVHGNFYPGLSTKVKDMRYSDRIRVVVRFKTGGHVPLDKTRHSTKELMEDSRIMLSKESLVSPDAVLGRYDLSPGSARGNNMIVVEADRVQLEALKVDRDVASIWEDREEEVMAPELSTLASSGYNPGSVPSGSGSGVKAATFEYGITSSFISCAGLSVSEYDAFILFAEDGLKRHSQATFRTLAASTPSATLYHRWSSTFNGSNDVSYISNRGIQTVSMSLTRGGTSPYRATYSEFLTMDNMAYSWPYPVYVTGTANSGYNYEVNWQSYNAISVGNVRHTNSSYFEMAECTQTKNPPPRYGGCISGSGADCAGDREMPHIVAPGIPNSGSTFATTCLEGANSVSCGTSLSAPVVNGMAANVIAADSRFVSWPEKVRAALILTAQNVESGHWTPSGDERDGAGTVSGSEAVAFASGHTTVSPGNTACEKGLGATSFYATDFGSNKRFNFLVPNPKPSGKHLRVVLTWDSNPNVSSGTNDLSDLDLIVQKNGGTQSSTSWDSNVEVVDVAAADLTAGSSYYIDISPYVNRIPSGLYFYYAIGWTWVKDHAP